MRESMRAVAVVIAVIGSLASTGCVTRNYNYAGEIYKSRADAEAAMQDAFDTTLRSIKPIDEPLADQLVFVIPTKEHVQYKWVRFTGNTATLSDDQIDYVLSSQVSGGEVCCRLRAGAGGLFQNVDVVTMEDAPSKVPASYTGGLRLGVAVGELRQRADPEAQGRWQGMGLAPDGRGNAERCGALQRTT